MGRKAKIGKQRRDRYYHLAKETGYRSRSAFKLIQLNRKYPFLQQSRVLIDLCAAPGGWLQVASRNMPVSSMIIGVDLFPIKPIPNVVTFTADITTTKCRMQLRKELKTWKADCILHDGAPNVGANWVLDAFSQAQLTLHALKLSCEFLNKGGWFVTKVFRSRDYQPLLWVFHQMFRKVHVTKPQASRNESAEIFVVCQSYIAPDKIDSKFFDPKYIFKDVGEDTKQKATILRDPAKVKKAKAEGYKDGDITLYHPVPVTEYMSSEDPLEVLNECSELVFDDPSIESNPLTSNEIKLCCRDIKVLGRREVRDLLNWHKKINKERSEAEEAAKQAEKAKTEDGKDKDSDEDEDDEVAKQLADLKEGERLAERRKKKDTLKRRKKLRERLHKTKELQSTMGDATQGESLFGLVNIKNKKQLEKVDTGDGSIVDDDGEQPRERQKKQLPSLKPVKMPKDLDDDEEEEDDDDDDDSYIDSELEEDEASALRAEIEKANDRYDTDSDVEFESDEEASDDETTSNPLVVDLEKEDPEEGARRRAKLWFRKGVFADLEEEDDEDIEISQATRSYEQQGGVVLERQKKAKEMEEDANGKKGKSGKSVKFNATITSIDSEGEEEEDSMSDDSDEDEDVRTKGKTKSQSGQRNKNGTVGGSRAGAGSYDSDSSDSDYDDEVMMRGDLGDEAAEERGDSAPGRKNKKGKRGADGGDDDVQNKKQVKLPKLDPEGLALGTLMATSKKATREIIEHAYNRYSYGDQDRIPDWLRQDESKHCRRKMPVSKELVSEYRARLREINARPIKKIAEAKARKKKRQVARVEKLRKKAQAISDMADTSEGEKMHQIKSLYKKFKLGNKKKDVSYVVSKKHTASKRVRRPKGVKGPFKVVDPRMKKDVRAQKRADAKRKKGKKR
ncbi:pre-rRNA 2'-O-ribose RNA methyltransferase FTSJ3-like [Diadema antillarum]|uniref:pre-rRNA 2'-O-ribose RNA methyltransferase FTSJ3-like n=1 Tax=Diadema antillarum TaxID=105358 RepID=UPI003A892090